MFSSSISITAACGAGFLLFGYDQGVFGGLLYNGKSSFAQLVTNIAEIVITNVSQLIFSLYKMLGAVSDCHNIVGDFWVYIRA
jgi:hypothetical protein